MSTAAGALYLDGTILRGALVSACDYVQRHRADLNRINVFPVPDGDTGTNFALTTRAIGDHLRANRDESVGRVAAAAAEASILGARGNCGMILSHFLLGLAESVGDRARLSVSEFAAVLRDATAHVYRALERPVEGTMLTIMRAISEEAQRLEALDFVAFLQRLLERAKEALARTPELLPALAAAGVVDAGAKGFVHLFEGMVAFISGDPIVALEDAPVFDAAPVGAAAVEFPTTSEQFRFCTEALVRGPGMPSGDTVRAALRDHGDSLVVIRSGEVLKVHIHTDGPDEVFAYLRGLGNLVSHKAEDMQVQHATVSRDRHVQLARRPVSLVADSACDLPEDVVRGHGIHLVPLSLIFEDEVLRDRVDIDAATFTERLLRGEHPSTSQPAPAAFLEAYRDAAEDGESVLAVLLSSALSGTYASAEAAARQFKDSPVRLVDSRAVTLSAGLLVLRAAELAELGTPPDQIATELERIRAQSGLLFTVDTFDRLLASGRVGRGRALIGSLLDIKPILALDERGAVVPIDRVRGRARLLPRVMELLAERIPSGARKVRFGVVHVACEPVVAEVSAVLRERYGDPEIIAGPVSPILATHAGAGAWGVAFQVED